MSKNIVTKTCTQCSVAKQLSEFCKDKSNKDGLRVLCKSCASKMWRKHYRTKDGVTNTIYRDQCKSSKHRNHPMPSYSLNELREWCYKQPIFHVLHGYWATSNYDKWEKPSCDRLDDYKPYTLSNIQVMTWSENEAKAHADRRNGINNKHSKAVIQMTIDGRFIREFHSVNFASREINGSHENISNCCNGKRPTHKGFKWKFADS